jgi:hypothetical protein
MMQAHSKQVRTDADPPADRSAYLPATAYIGRPGVETYKRLKAALRANPWIKTYVPRPFRLEIHAGDWFRFERSLDVNGLDLLEVTAESAAEFEAAARAIRLERLRRTTAV